MEEHKLTLVLFLVSALQQLSLCLPLEGSKTSSCSASGIAVYRMTFQTFWSRDKFSKQYPTHRPHAQWSRLIGRTHSAEYLLWRAGELASAGVKQFAEDSSSLHLDQESQGHKGVFDIFSSPKIDSGVGISSSLIFLDSKHHLVSLMSHLIPSPDWFVGMDSVSLCSDNQWEDKKYISLNIWDAGTDKGFTFTSPNWPEVPARGIEAITASHPSHPASSFFYHHTKALPEIARIVLTRDTVAENTQLQRDWSALKGEHMPNTAEINQVAADKSTKPQVGDTSVTIPLGEHVKPAAHVAPPSGPVGKKETRVSVSDVVNTTPKPKKTRKHKLSKEERLQKKREREEKRQRRERKIRERQNRKSKSKQVSLVSQKNGDCQVSEWQEWSACSKSCGYGSQVRMRTVVVARSGNGAPCPPLSEDQMCGSMRGCGWTHFNSNNWGTVLK